MNQLTTSNWIEIISIIASLTVSFASIWIALKSLNRAEKSAKALEVSNFNAERPYVTIYSTGLNTGVMSFHKFLIIKNFGKSAAKVKLITYTGELDANNQSRNLTSLHDFVLAPGMSVRSNIDAAFKNTVIFHVEYSDLQGHSFNETFDVNFGFGDTLVYAEASKGNMPKGYNELIAALHIIAQQLQD